MGQANDLFTPALRIKPEHPASTAACGFFQTRPCLGSGACPVWPAVVDGGEPDIISLKKVAIPGQDPVVLMMFGVGHSAEELFKARQAANIFGRSATGAFDKARIADQRIERPGDIFTDPPQPGYRC